jgi:hypothetical protein
MPRRKSLSANRSSRDHDASENDAPTADTADDPRDLMPTEPARHETANVVETRYRSPEPSEREIRDLIGTCFLLETSSRQFAITAPTASRVEALCVPHGWTTFPSSPNTNRDEIPIVLRLRDVFRHYGHERVEELWFLRVQFTLASALDALDRARAADDVSADIIVSDIEALDEEIRNQRALRG